MRWLRIFPFAALCLAALGGQPESRGSHMGVLLRDLTPERAQELKLDSPRGAEVMGVEIGSPAADAGVQPRDVLLAYNNEPIVGKEQLGRLVSQTPPGRRVSIQVWRNGRPLLAWVITSAVASQTLLAPDFPPDVPGNILVWRNRILGTECETMPAQMAAFFGVTHGILVRFVEKGALGDTSGLKPGDIIQASSDRPILSPRDLSAALLADTGTIHAARLFVWRDHKRVILDVHPPD